MKILIVEDDDNLREIMVDSLEKERYIVSPKHPITKRLCARLKIMIMIVSCWISCCLMEPDLTCCMNC